MSLILMFLGFVFLCISIPLIGFEIIVELNLVYLLLVQLFMILFLAVVFRIQHNRYMRERDVLIEMVLEKNMMDEFNEKILK